jgi:hypothetical protein
MPGDFDAAWAAIVEYFAITNLPIRTIEKASGLIVTEWLDAGVGDEDGPYCDCGGSGLAVAHWTRGKFSVFLKDDGVGAVDLRVTCTYQQYRTFGDVDGMVDCNSTGYLETQLHSYVIANVEGSDVPEVPTFKPGHSE